MSRVSIDACTESAASRPIGVRAAELCPSSSGLLGSPRWSGLVGLVMYHCQPRGDAQALAGFFTPFTLTRHDC